MGVRPDFSDGNPHEGVNGFDCGGETGLASTGVMHFFGGGDFGLGCGRTLAWRMC